MSWWNSGAQNGGGQGYTMTAYEQFMQQQKGGSGAIGGPANRANNIRGQPANKFGPTNQATGYAPGTQYGLAAGSREQHAQAAGQIGQAHMANQAVQFDFNKASGLAEERNRGIDDVLSRQRGFLDGLGKTAQETEAELKGLLGPGGPLETMKADVSRNVGEIDRITGEHMERATKYGDDTQQRVDQALGEHEKRYYADESANIAAMRQQLRSTEQSTIDQARARGASEGEIRELTHALKGQALQGIHTTIAGKQAEWRNTRVQAQMAGAELVSRSRQMEMGERGRGVDHQVRARETAKAYSQFAAQYSASVTSQLVENQWRMAAVEEAGLGQYAQMISGLIKSFPSMHEMIVTMGLNQTVAGSGTFSQGAFS